MTLVSSSPLTPVTVSFPFPFTLYDAVETAEAGVGKTRSGASRKLQTPDGRSDMSENIWDMRDCWMRGGREV